MKKFVKFSLGAIVLVIALVLLAATAAPARAAAPAYTPVQIAIAGCTGMDPATTALAEQAYDTRIGTELGLDTPVKWAKTYVSRAIGFGNSVGLPNLFYDDGVTDSGVLNFAGKICLAIGTAEYPPAP